MPTTFHLRVWTRFFVPVEEVWAVKTDPERVSAEFFPFASMRWKDVGAARQALSGVTLPAELQATVSLPFAPVGVPWPIRLDAFERGVRFRDTSVNALYSRFEHEHVFEKTSDGCRYVDIVTFTPTAPLQKLAAIATRRLFVHRHNVVARQLAADPQVTGVGVLRVMVEEETAAA
jgi:ligand-binding SRPBCC domain-containing protein